MTNRIDRLVATGLVTRKYDPADRHSVIVSLTSKRLRTIDNAIHLRLNAADDGIHGQSSKERATLAMWLRKEII